MSIQNSWSVFSTPSNFGSIFSFIDGVMDKRVIIYANRFNDFDIVDNVTMSVAFHRDSVEITMNSIYHQVMMNIKYIKSDGHIEVATDSTYVYCEDENRRYMTPPANHNPEYVERWILLRFLSVFDSNDKNFIFNLFNVYADTFVRSYLKCDKDEKDKKEV